MMRRILSLAATLPLCLLPGGALGQSRWSGEVTGDAAFATQKLAGAELRTGGGFGANVRFLVQPHLAAYAGWEWHMQQTDELLPGQMLDLNDNGYTLGLRFEHPLAGPTAGWLRAGALYNHIEVEEDDGSLIHDTDHGFGWEAGAGLTIPLGARLGVTPGVRFRSLSRDITVGGRTRSSTLSYLTAGAGLAFTF